METKKKLRKDLDALMSIFMKEIGELKLQVAELQEAKEEEADIITGKEAARLLGYSYEYVSSTWLGKVGIKYSKGDNGCLKISRRSLEDYLTNRLKTHED